MYSNQNVNLSQFYPSQSYSTRTAYPYPFYIQPNHPMNIASPPSTQKTPVTYHNEIFTNAPPIPSIPATSARFQGEYVYAYLTNYFKEL